ncbi:MAG: hypothetical protein KF893_05615 [Caldilineaceae bacterium]|nr:hypothetical protein [Caldilineaceae bacterium]
MTLPLKSLVQIVAERPYPDYADWWRMGETFLRCMSDAIVTQWRTIHQNPQPLEIVEQHVVDYLHTVYGRSMRAGLVTDFATVQNLTSIQSGEFDAISYGFYRAAFEWIDSHLAAVGPSPAEERRAFTEQVGAHFYRQLHDRLGLTLPQGLDSEEDFAELQRMLAKVGDFLVEEGYLRDHFAFRFDVETIHQGRQISQKRKEALADLAQHGLIYALYEMGYPAILPSATYLYHTLGEAQHHSSRTIQELFLRLGYNAAETDDFDPTGFPSDRVVELWEIRPLG